MSGLPAPYSQLNDVALDGLAIYRDRRGLGLTDADFTALGVPSQEPVDDWVPSDLAYTATFSAGPVTLTLPRHDGGSVDWYSATARGPDPSPPTAPVSGRAIQPGFPSPAARTHAGGRSRIIASTRVRFRPRGQT